MLYDKTICGDLEALAEYLGINREDCWGRWVDKPYCSTCGGHCRTWEKGRFETEFVHRNGTVKRFVTTQEYAKRLRISETTMRRWLRSGRLTVGVVKGHTRDFIDTEKVVDPRKLEPIERQAA